MKDEMTEENIRARRDWLGVKVIKEHEDGSPALFECNTCGRKLEEGDEACHPKTR
jgi:hypothetical protein